MTPVHANNGDAGVDTEPGSVAIPSQRQASSFTFGKNSALNSRKDIVFSERLDELKKFREEFGHVQVPKSHANKRLYNWIKNKRSEESDFKEGRRKTHPFTEVQLERLKEVGFLFDVQVPKLTKCFRCIVYNIKSFKQQNSGSTNFFSESAKHNELDVTMLQKAYTYLVEKKSQFSKAKLRL